MDRWMEPLLMQHSVTGTNPGIPICEYLIYVFICFVFFFHFPSAVCAVLSSCQTVDNYAIIRLCWNQFLTGKQTRAELVEYEGLEKKTNPKLTRFGQNSPFVTYCK